MTARWQGTQRESFELHQAVDRHCACLFGALGVRLAGCPAHRMLEEQRALDGLLYARRLAERLRQEEWRSSTGAPWPLGGSPQSPG